MRKPLGLDYSPEQLKAEKDYKFVAAYLKQKLVACLLIMPLDHNVARIRHVAVDEGLQGKGIGKALMQFSENYLQQSGFAQIILYARESAFEFYTKLNYQKFGEPFLELDLIHSKMSKNLL